MSLSVLVKVGLGVGVVGTGALIWMERRVQNMYKQQTFYRESVRLLQNYKHSAQYLGKPIYSGRVTLGDKERTDIAEFTAKLVIPVTGSIDKGSLYVQASRENRQTDWTIEQLDIELKGSQQRWTFYQRDKDESSAGQGDKDNVPATDNQQS